MRRPMGLLAAYVEAHNTGVRSGDFEALVGLLLPTASMRFHGIDIGPVCKRGGDPPGVPRPAAR